MRLNATGGSKNRQAKLTEDDVRYIRKNYHREAHSTSNGRELAAKFGVSNVTILQVVNFHRWKDVV